MASSLSWPVFRQPPDSWQTLPMIPAIVLAFVILVVIPVGFLMSMAIVSAIMGFAMKTNAEAEADGSELIDLNY